MIEDMGVLRITEAELARDLHRILEKVRQGTEIFIEQDNGPVAVLRPAVRRRKLSEIASSLRKDSTSVLDPGFETDVQGFIDSHREPLNAPEWK